VLYLVKVDALVAGVVFAGAAMIILVLLAWHKRKPSETGSRKPGSTRHSLSRIYEQSWLCAIVTRFVLDHTPHC
jgi:hypothetical protein